jgi:hypothetical protein
MPMLLPALLLQATLGSTSACPPDVCLESAIRPEPEPPVYGRSLRAMMRSFGRLRGARPRFITTEGTPLSPSMSVASIERRLRADGGNPAFRVLYGRCASHDESCPWADIEVRVHTEVDLLDCDAATVSRVTRAGQHVVVEHLPANILQEFEVSIGPGGCAGDQPASDDTAPAASTLSAWIYVSGTHGMAHAALGALSVRAITRALAG